MIFRKKLVQDGKKLGKNKINFKRKKTKNFSLSDDVKKRYEQKAAVEKQKYEVRVAEYKKSGGGASSVSPAKGSKGSSTASSSKKSPRKPVGKKAATKSSEEDNDDDDDDDEDEE